MQHDLNGIQAFVSVAQVGSIRAAARRLGIPKSTLSRRIADLEAALGFRLMQRTAQAVRITPEGEAYLAAVAPAVQAIEDAGNALARVGSMAGGALRLSVPPAFGELFLTPILARYLARHPGGQVIVDLSDRHIDFAAEPFDLAIRAGRLKDPDLVQRRIGRAEVIHVAAPQYFAAHGEPARPAELTAHACLVQTLEPGGSTWTFRDGVSVPVAGPLSISSWGMLRAAARAGLGIARLQRFYVAADLAEGALVAVLERYSPSADLHVVYPSARLLPARTRAFVDLLLEALGDEPWPAMATPGGRPRKGRHR